MNGRAGNRGALLLSAFATGSVSLLAAVFFLALDDWFGNGDLPAFVLFSLPLLGVVPALAGLSNRLLRRWVYLRYALALLLGYVVATAWTAAVALALGPMFGAFSFPVGLCWLIGSVSGLLVALWWEQRRSWPAALSMFLLACAITGVLYAGESAPESAFVIHVKRGATNGEVQSVRRQVIAQPSPTGGGLRATRELRPEGALRDAPP